MISSETPWLSALGLHIGPLGAVIPGHSVLWAFSTFYLSKRRIWNSMSLLCLTGLA